MRPARLLRPDRIGLILMVPVFQISSKDDLKREPDIKTWHANDVAERYELVVCNDHVHLTARVTDELDEAPIVPDLEFDGRHGRLTDRAVVVMQGVQPRRCR